jgi:hypothetical protein
METETKSCVLDIYFGGETYFNLRYLNIVEKSVTNKCLSKNSTPAMPRLKLKTGYSRAIHRNKIEGTRTHTASLAPQNSH